MTAQQHTRRFKNASINKKKTLRNTFEIKNGHF